MADVSFAHVSTEGFTAFSAQLDDGVWGSIDVSTYVGADGRLVKSMGEAPAFVFFKVKLLLGINDVVCVVQSTGSAKACDDSWDNVQKRFSGLIAVARASTSPQEKAAAGRLHGLLLLGKSGEGQTRLKYQQEVDFGRNQMRMAAEPQCAADLALLGLGSIMAQIASATEDLAIAIGQGRADLVPSRQKRAALAECMQVFGTVYQSLDWIAKQADVGPDGDTAIALRSSLHELALKYPARVTKPNPVAKAAPVVTPPLN